MVVVDDNKRDEDREVGIPGDVIFSGVMLQNADLWWVTDAIKELHNRGITGKSVKVCIADTGGVDDHPNLKAPFKMIDNTNSRSGARDINGHGTACSFIVVKIAPDCEYMTIKVLGDSGSGSMASINNAYRQAGEHGCHLYNGSYGDNGGPPIQSDVVSLQAGYDAGLWLINIAAGNAGFNGRRNTVGRPANYPSTGCTGATDRNGRISNFSSGGDELDWAAFGQDMPFAHPGGGMTQGSGTSFACPWMVGLFALLIQVRRQLGFRDLKGRDDWREFFADNDLLIDAGQAGEDPSYGLGIPGVNKITQWMLDNTPEWT